MGLITIVGLGPGGDGHLTAETLSAIARHEHRFLRTSRHPSAHLVGAAESFDDAYEAAEVFADVYATIVDRLVAAADAHGDVLYAVPGSPLMLERTVALLTVDERATCRVLPAMSFLDVAWARLGIDPIESGVRLVDGHEFTAAAADRTGPMLIAHTHANWVLSDIKLAVEDATGDEPVVILQGLGTTDELVVETTWSELDRAVEADHLTCVYVPGAVAPVGAGYVRFHELARTLREQCPWDIEQTHASLVPYLLEETYELVDALAGLDADDPAADAHVVEELGDLLYQIEFHAVIAEQQGRFSIGDVTAGIHDKLVRRHPHVFAPGAGGVDDPDSAADVLARWDEIKQAEKQRTSVFDGVATSQPALSLAQQLGRRAAKSGFDWLDVAGALAKVDEELAELREAMEAESGGEHPEQLRASERQRASGQRRPAWPGNAAEELGDLLFAVVNVARHLGIDAEVAMRAAANKFRRRYEAVAAAASARGLVLADAGLPVLDELWDDVKRGERS